MTLNTHIERTVSALIITAGLGSAAWLGTAIGHAEPQGMIYLSEISDTWWYTVDELPVCVQEDCSDQPGQIGMWLDRDTGNWYLSTGEESMLVVDDTVGWDEGYEN